MKKKTGEKRQKRKKNREIILQKENYKERNKQTNKIDERRRARKQK